MKDKIFISHSSKDITIVEAFVDKVLKLGMGVIADRIFCTSMPGHGISSGSDIPDMLREEVREAGLAFLFISKNYKASEVCLNEMGAAWICLEKSYVIPILLPDIDFSDIGFININKLGIRITDRNALVSLIEDHRNFFNTQFKLPLLIKHLNEFLSAEMPEIEPSSEISFFEDEQYKCFNVSLTPFGEVSKRSLSHLEDGIYHIKNRTLITSIFKELSEKQFQHNLWYAFSGGDMHIDSIKLLSNGNILINSWENAVSELWISINRSLTDEFILFKSNGQQPYPINSDQGGKEHHVGILGDGTVVSNTELQNGYALIMDETIDLHERGVKYRYNYPRDQWVFIATSYHKIGNNLNKSESLCTQFDTEEVIPTEEILRKFLRELHNHPTVIQYR